MKMTMQMATNIIFKNFKFRLIYAKEIEIHTNGLIQLTKTHHISSILIQVLSIHLLYLYGISSLPSTEIFTQKLGRHNTN